MTAKAPRRRSPKPRPNEIIGGGFFVFRRGKKTGRVGVFTTMPYEHGSFEQALAEATRLAALCPGETFEVFQTSGAVVGPVELADTPVGTEWIVTDPIVDRVHELEAA